MEKQPYQKPTVTELGTLRDHTKTTVNASINVTTTLSDKNVKTGIRAI